MTKEPLLQQSNSPQFILIYFKAVNLVTLCINNFKWIRRKLGKISLKDASIYTKRQMLETSQVRPSWRNIELINGRYCRCIARASIAFTELSFEPIPVLMVTHCSCVGPPQVNESGQMTVRDDHWEKAAIRAIILMHNQSPVACCETFPCCTHFCLTV